MPIFSQPHLRFLAAAWVCCSLSPLNAATHIDFHPGETLDFLRVDGHGENNEHIVVTWLRGLSVIDARSLAVADLDTGRFVGPIAATGGPFFYYDHDVGASESALKSLSHNLEIQVVGTRRARTKAS